MRGSVSFVERNLFEGISASLRLLIGLQPRRFPNAWGFRYVLLLAVHLLLASFSLVFGWRHLTPIPAMAMCLVALLGVGLCGVALARPQVLWAYMLASVPLDVVALGLLGFPGVPVEVFWCLEAWRFIAVVLFSWKQPLVPDVVPEVPVEADPIAEPEVVQPCADGGPQAYAWLTSLKSTETQEVSKNKED